MLRRDFRYAYISALVLAVSFQRDMMLADVFFGKNVSSVKIRMDASFKLNLKGNLILTLTFCNVLYVYQQC